MASSTPTSWAQEVIICDLCDKPVQQFCNNCQVNLCEDCINKHVNKHKSLTHDIVPFKNRKIHLVFPECEVHPNQRCEVHCQKCDVPVCIKCFLGQHKGHDAVELSDIIEGKKQQIKKETEEIESLIIPKYNDAVIENKILKLTAEYDELEKETERQRKCWHQEVDTIFNHLSSLIKSMRDNCMEATRTHKAKCKNVITEMIQTVKQNKEILKTNRVSEVNDYKSKLKEYRDIPADIDVKVPSLNTKTVQGRELSIELGEYKATLTQTTLSSLTDEVSFLSMRELLDKARVIATIPTGVKHLRNVACVGTDEVWVSGRDKVIRRVDIHGSVQESVTTTHLYSPGDISVTRQGELIYSHPINDTVNIVRHGRIEVMITTPQGWRPLGLCCTRSGDILVSVNNNRQNKIIRYQGKIMKQEIDKNEDGNPIFKEGNYMLYVGENNNGDICVSDLNANILIVVDKTGRVRFRYNGTPAMREKPFRPRKIVTDAMSQIIVADYNNACLHILEQNGQLLRCVDNCGLDKPKGLSLDSEGRLWVGLFDSGEVKVISTGNKH